jgi:hypothetical protein
MISYCYSFDVSAIATEFETATGTTVFTTEFGHLIDIAFTALYLVDFAFRDFGLYVNTILNRI